MQPARAAISSADGRDAITGDISGTWLSRQIR
jgi:hypothetical protein